MVSACPKQCGIVCSATDQSHRTFAHPLCRALASGSRTADLGLTPHARYDCLTPEPQNTVLCSCDRNVFDQRNTLTLATMPSIAYTHTRASTSPANLGIQLCCPEHLTVTQGQGGVVLSSREPRGHTPCLTFRLPGNRHMATSSNQGRPQSRDTNVKGSRSGSVALFGFGPLGIGPRFGRFK